MPKTKSQIAFDQVEVPNNSPRGNRTGKLQLDATGGANQDDRVNCDINKIVAQHTKFGTLPNVQLKNPLYGDYTFPEDIHSMREAVQSAEDRFNQLPSAVRSASNNDWVQFLTMFDDEEQRPTLEAAGLTTNNPETKPTSPPGLPKSSVVEPAAPDPSTTTKTDG